MFEYENIEVTRKRGGGGDTERKREEERGSERCQVSKRRGEEVKRWGENPRAKE